MGDYIRYKDPRVNRDFDVEGLRKQLKLTQIQMSRAVGCTERVIRMWERRTHRPQRVFILRLRALKAEADASGGRPFTLPQPEQRPHSAPDADPGLSPL